MNKGERIKKLREENGYTQDAMAKALKTTKQTISKYELGIVTNIPSDRIEAIAKLFNSTPEYILGWEQVQKSNDIIVDIIARLRTDDEFLSTVQVLFELDNEKLRSVQQMLSAFTK